MARAIGKATLPEYSTMVSDRADSFHALLVSPISDVGVIVSDNCVMPGECPYNMAARPRRPAPTMPTATGAFVGARPALLADAVALAATLLAEPVSDATMDETLEAAEAATLLAEDRAELATDCAEDRADGPCVLADERSEFNEDWTLASLELSEAETDEA